ncbi:Phasin protein [Yoonia tamlensis]|uniref:Phasin protein n=1 Tax=Yoonia tamlensis TaxID=390270 RepID=A0A1I6FZH8_9RHOB|nr:phasin family protein [Yoonia tamlensis]SFR35363.1 Phasin protein [Yoonia tamlensis]
MATKTQDFTAIFKDVADAFPVDTKAMEEQFKNQTALAEKLSAVALDAAGKSAELSAKWTQDTIAKLEAMSKSKVEPADYAKAVTDFASATAESAAENMSAFAEIAKKVQTQTMELVLAAGKDISDEVTAAAKKATSEVTAAASKATKK